MNRSSLVIGGLVCVVGLAVGLLIVTLFGSNRVGDSSVAQAFTPVVAPSVISATATSQPTNVSTSVVSPTLGASAATTQTPVAATNTSAATSGATPPTRSVTATTSGAVLTRTSVATSGATPPTRSVTATTSGAATRVATSSATTPTTSATAGAYLVYRVKAGDTLRSIARAFGVTIQDILEINSFTNPDVLKIDQQIRIPKRTS